MTVVSLDRLRSTSRFRRIAFAVAVAGTMTAGISGCDKHGFTERVEVFGHDLDGLSDVRQIYNEGYEGNASQAEKMGDLLLSGKRVRQDVAQAIEWYERAHRFGSTTSAIKIVRMLNTHEDHVRRANLPFGELIEYAASADSTGQTAGRVARLYWAGDLVEQSDEKALQFFMMAARQGQSINWLPAARIASDKKSSAFNPDLALEAFLSAGYEADRADAFAGAGRILTFGLGNLEPNHEEAIRILEISEMMGDETATYMLGRIFANSKSDHYDVEKAEAKLIASAARVPSAHYYIGYLNETKKDADLNKAILHYEQAANNGSASAMFRLGFVYQMQGSSELAISWYQKALDEGIQAAKTKIAELTRKDS